ncbi:nitroreductase family protein [Pareuzebyella sediminis]|uniref:nitroreductase family protein n=1 Tax=Pareuzebyella sediminis TaxID=2607998 RepID=UPI0011EDC68A|nr:nitroreductase family protein [Pareuzebyella sediminis]
MNREEQIRLENIADTEHEIFALLKQRYSPRIFEEKMISEKDLNRLFEAVRWSASSFNRQPWRFIYAKKGEDGYTSILECLTDGNKKWADNAPLLMITLFKEDNDEGEKNFYALHDLGLSLGNMTIQAQYMGIGLHHMAGIDQEKAQKMFEVSDGFKVASALALGYYGGNIEALPEDLKKREVAERKRKRIDQFAFHGKWKN